MLSGSGAPPHELAADPVLEMHQHRLALLLRKVVNVSRDKGWRDLEPAELQRAAFDVVQRVGAVGGRESLGFGFGGDAQHCGTATHVPRTISYIFGQHSVPPSLEDGGHR